MRYRYSVASQSTCWCIVKNSGRNTATYDDDKSPNSDPRNICNDEASTRHTSIIEARVRRDAMPPRGQFLRSRSVSNSRSLLLACGGARTEQGPPAKGSGCHVQEDGPKVIARFELTETLKSMRALPPYVLVCPALCLSRKSARSIHRPWSWVPNATLKRRERNSMLCLLFRRTLVFRCGDR